jgi:hypothetical protein
MKWASCDSFLMVSGNLCNQFLNVWLHLIKGRTTSSPTNTVDLVASSPGSLEQVVMSSVRLSDLPCALDEAAYLFK